MRSFCNITRYDCEVCYIATTYILEGHKSFNYVHEVLSTPIFSIFTALCKLVSFVCFLFLAGIVELITKVFFKLIIFLKDSIQQK